MKPSTALILSAVTHALGGQLDALRRRHVGIIITRLALSRLWTRQRACTCRCTPVSGYCRGRCQQTWMPHAELRVDREDHYSHRKIEPRSDPPRRVMTNLLRFYFTRLGPHRSIEIDDEQAGIGTGRVLSREPVLRPFREAALLPLLSCHTQE